MQVHRHQLCTIIMTNPMVGILIENSEERSDRQCSSRSSHIYTQFIIYSRPHESGSRDP